MLKNFKNIILGTVQFGIPYGRRKDCKVLDKKISEKILNKAWELGIRKFDTAESYGLASNFLANWLKKRSASETCEVSTKINIDKITDLNHIINACSKFSDTCIVHLMTHGAVSYDVWNSFKTNCDHINVFAGQSVYLLSEMINAENLGAKLIQVPCNIFESKKIKNINKSKTRIDIRSVYLQGLFLEEPNNAEKRVTGSGFLINILKEIEKECNTPLAVLLLRSILDQIKEEDHIVIGIDCTSQFSDIISAFNVNEEIIKKFLCLIKDQNTQNKILNYENLFDPRKWNR
jgi:hypothetical protein